MLVHTACACLAMARALRMVPWYSVRAPLYIRCSLAFQPWRAAHQGKSKKHAERAPAPEHATNKGASSSTRPTRRFSGRCWMARDCPIKLHQLTPLLDVVGNTNKYIGKIARFFEKYGQMDLFPVKMQARACPPWGEPGYSTSLTTGTAAVYRLPASDGESLSAAGRGRGGQYHVVL